jgi:hypothetical protein
VGRRSSRARGGRCGTAWLAQLEGWRPVQKALRRLAGAGVGARFVRRLRCLDGCAQPPASWGAASRSWCDPPALGIAGRRKRWAEPEAAVDPAQERPRPLDGRRCVRLIGSRALAVAGRARLGGPGRRRRRRPVEPVRPAPGREAGTGRGWVRPVRTADVPVAPHRRRWRRTAARPPARSHGRIAASDRRRAPRSE